ncbi:conserved exported hypothetical protein [Vibrio chagasii]|nr:conserved exported hypothetical protein [Vibrio chagasii]
MKLFSLFLMLLVSLNASASSLPAWNNSPQLDALIGSFKQTYQEATHEFDKKQMSRVNNLSFFIRFIDKEGTPEQAQLKAFLLGTQQAYASSVYNQIQMNIRPWFCPKGGQLGIRPYSENPTQFIENVIWEALERTLKVDPNRFTRSNGVAAFTPTNSLVQYGLQTQYPCHQVIPEAHRMNGWVY